MTAAPDPPYGVQLQPNYTNLFVGAVVVLSLLAVGAVVTIFLVRPDKDSTSLIATILGFVVPVVTGFIAAAVQQVHSSVNGRLTQLLKLTAKSSLAEGKAEAEGKAKASETSKL